MTTKMKLTPTKWDATVIRSRVRDMKRHWGEVWKHASPQMREALAWEVAHGFLTCRDDVALTGRDVLDLHMAIREAAGLADEEVTA